MNILIEFLIHLTFNAIMVFVFWFSSDQSNTSIAVVCFIIAVFNSIFACAEAVSFKRPEKLIPLILIAVLGWLISLNITL